MKYQIQSWDAEKNCTCFRMCGEDHRPNCPYPGTGYRWVPMENGLAKSVWKPRKTPQEAVAKAAEWSGAVWNVGIPAMQVVELATGTVVWRSSAQYPDAGDPIEPGWMASVYSSVKARNRADREAETQPEPADEQEALF